MSNKLPLKLYFEITTCKALDNLPEIEGIISRYEKVLVSTFYLKIRGMELILQSCKKTSYFFENYQEYIMLLVDKNIGLCAMSRLEYV